MRMVWNSYPADERAHFDRLAATSRSKPSSSALPYTDMLTACVDVRIHFDDHWGYSVSMRTSCFTLASPQFSSQPSKLRPGCQWLRSRRLLSDSIMCRYCRYQSLISRRRIFIAFRCAVRFDTCISGNCFAGKPIAESTSTLWSQQSLAPIVPFQSGVVRSQMPVHNRGLCSSRPCIVALHRNL